MTTTLQDTLIGEARRIETALSAALSRATSLREVRTDSMNRMHQAGIPWAQIARTYGVTPQAAMYATGHSSRQATRTQAPTSAGSSTPPAAASKRDRSTQRSRGADTSGTDTAASG